MIKLEIDENTITYNGAVYTRCVDYDSQKCGRTEIAEMCGFFHSDGTPNVNNLYPTNSKARYCFPNFEIEKANKGAKPWTRKEVREWLSIPLKDRERMYKETLDEFN